jgi:hypothetical protein
MSVQKIITTIGTYNLQVGSNYSHAEVKEALEGGSNLWIQDGPGLSGSGAPHAVRFHGAQVVAVSESNVVK